MRARAVNGVYELAKRDERVIFIGSDLGAGTLAKMREEMPERFFMEGISEAHIIGMAAGLAMDGFIPYINTIATFLTRRCFEQTALDVCLHRLPVRLIASGGGTVYAPLGPTHIAMDDIALMRVLPNMTIVAPVDADEMSRVMDASLSWRDPIYIRLAKGGDPIVSRDDRGFAFGKAIAMREGDDVAFVTSGVMTTRALNVAELLEKEGISCAVIHMHTIKPLDEDAVLMAARRVRLVVTLEEHSRIGGLGSAVAETLADRGVFVSLVRLGLPDRFLHDYGSQESQLNAVGLSIEEVAGAVREGLRAAVNA